LSDDGLIQSTPEERGCLLLAMRRAGVNDIGLLRAIETLPRERFVPPRFQDLAHKNISLPIACGQTMSRPVDLGRRLQALRVTKEHRVLEVGAGSAYATALLAHLGRDIVSFERYQTLARSGQQRLREQGVTNANIIFGDGLAISDLGSFDRILVNLALGDVPLTLQALLNPGGVLVFALSASAPGCKKQQLIKVTKSLLAGFVSEHIGVTRLTASCIGSSQTM